MKSSQKDQGDSEESIKFSNILYEELGKSGTHLNGFSKRVGVSGALMSMWVNRKRRSPGFVTVVRVWRKLGRSLDKDFL